LERERDRIYMYIYKERERIHLYVEREIERERDGKRESDAHRWMTTWTKLRPAAPAFAAAARCTASPRL
jgi:hypothetical protein